MGNEQLVRRGPIGDGDTTAGQLIAQGETVRQIQTSYATAVAVQKPRDLVKVENDCLKEAALAGEVCFYGWGTGQNRVEGPSIDCAMIAARNFGNAVVEMKPIQETGAAYIMEAAFIDLETGFTYTRQFRQSKSWTVYGRMDDERKADVRFQIGQSKAQRNVILKALPKWLIDKMVEKAKAGVREQIQKHIDNKGIESARKRAADVLAKLGVPVERVESKYGKKYAKWDIELLVVLQGDIRAISDGVESAETLFPEDASDDTPKKAAKGTLDTADMKPGDPTTHQGYENEAPEKPKEDEPKPEPEPEPEPPVDRVPLVKEIEELEVSRKIDKREFRDGNLGYIDLEHKDITVKELTMYRDLLKGMTDKSNGVTF